MKNKSKALICTLGLCLLAISNFSQTKADTLIKLLKLAKQDTVKIRLRFEIGEAQKILRIGYWDSLRKDADKFSVKKYKAYALMNSAGIYIMQGNTDLAMQLSDTALHICEQINDKNGIANALGNIGGIYTQLGDVIKALECHSKSLKIKEELNEKEGIANAMNNVAYLLGFQGEFDKAQAYFEKILKYREQTKNKPEIARTLVNMSYVSREKQDTQTTIKLLERALQISESINDKYTISTTMGNLGVIYGTAGKYSLALDCFIKSLKMQEEIGDVEGKAYSLHNIGDIYFKQNKMPEAIDYANQSLEFSKKLGYPQVIKISAELLIGIYKKQNNYKDAYKMQGLYIRMRDSLNNTETKQAALKNQAQYEFDKKEIAIKLEQEKKDAIAVEEKRKQQIIIASVSVGLLLMLVLAGVILRSLRVNQKKNKIITEQKHILEEKHKEISDSINYAERIQRSFLATKDLLDENLKEYFVFFQPKDIVSGDFYWASKLNNDQFVLVTADSTGHGVPGAIMSILNTSSLEKAVESGLSQPNEILNHTRKNIIERLQKDGSATGGKDGMDCSLISFDFKQNKLTYASANNPVLIVRDEQMLEFASDKMPVGKHDKDNTSFSQHIIEVQKGDMVYALTDGMPDQFGGPKGKKFMYKQLKTLLLSIAHLTVQEQKQTLITALNNWKGNLEQVDDITLIGVRI